MQLPSVQTSGGKATGGGPTARGLGDDLGSQEAMIGRENPGSQGRPTDQSFQGSPRIGPQSPKASAISLGADPEAVVGVFPAKTAERAKRAPGNPPAGDGLGNGTSGLDNPKGSLPKLGGGSGIEGGRGDPVDTAREILKADTTQRQAM